MPTSVKTKRSSLAVFVLGYRDELGEESLSDAKSSTISAERAQSLKLVVVRCDLQQTRQRLGVSAPVHHAVAGCVPGRRQQVIDDVGRRQRLVKLAEENVDVQTALAVQQVDLTHRSRETTVSYKLQKMTILAL